MAIVKSISQSEFIDMFTEYSRENNFSYYSKIALYEYYDNYSNEMDEPYTLDIIDICCTWDECSSMAETINEYGYLVDIDNTDEEEWRKDNDISIDKDSNGVYVQELNEYEQNDIEEFIFEEVLSELIQHTTIIRMDEQNTIDPSMNIDGVLVQSF